MRIQHRIILIGLTILVGILLVNRYTMTHDHKEHAHFSAKECFVFFNHPDDKVDGMIMYKEDLYYVIMWTPEADRRYPGPKQGNRIPIAYMDEYASHIQCPKGWVK